MFLHSFYYLIATILFAGFLSNSGFAAGNIIEKQIAEIGSVPNEEVVVVQRKYTRKNWRSEFTPFTLGGMPFGTVRRSLMAGASYTLHINDWFGLELFNFAYNQTIFSSFTDDINANKGSGLNPTQNNIKPDYQKLNFLLTSGIQWTPFYGKVSTFSKWIGYIEPFFTFGAGLAKTETSQYFAFFPGIGVRTFFKEWFSMKLEFRDYMYTETFTDRSTVPATQSSALRMNYAVLLSLSFWLPKMPL